MPKPLTTWLPDYLAEKFEIYCDQEGHCKSDMLRKIVMEWLDKKMKEDDNIVAIIVDKKKPEKKEKD